MESENESTLGSMTQIRSHMRTHKGWYRFGGVVLVVLVVFGLWYNNQQTRIKTFANGYGQEKHLTVLANSVQIDLSNCLDKSAQTAGITQAEYNSLKGTLVSVAMARYQTAGGQPTTASAVAGTGKFFSAVFENNPTIDLSGWKTLVSVVDGCRDDVAGDQKHLQIAVADFQTWTQGGGPIFTHSWRSSFPDNNLVVVDPVTLQKMHGQDALSFLTRVISLSSASQAVHSGVMPEQTLFPSQPAAPSPSASH